MGFEFSVTKKGNNANKCAFFWKPNHRPAATSNTQLPAARWSNLCIALKVQMERACLFFFFPLKAQHTHQPDLRADQHVRHPCSQPEGGLQPSRKETWESSVSVIQLAPFRLPVKTPTAADQSQLLQSGSDVDVKPRSTGATTQMLIITALIEFT